MTEGQTEGARTRLRLGIVGCGRVVERYYLPALNMHRDWDLAAVCEPRLDRRAWAQQAWPGVAAFASVAQFLAESRVDAVVVATPPVTHASLATQILEAGVHVLVEKPLATDVADARALRDTSRQAGNRLRVGFNRRFVGIYMSVKEHLAGTPVQHIRSIVMRLTTNPSAWNPVTASAGDSASGTDALDDLASHHLDLLPWLMDAGVAAVRARAAAPGRDSMRIRYDVRLDNGLEVRCECAHGAAYVETVECALNDRRLFATDCRDLEVHGATTGMLRGLPLPRVIAAALSRRRAVPGNPVRESFARQLSAFASEVRREPSHPRVANAGRGAAVVRAVAACRQSISSGGSWVPVTWEATREP